MNIERYDIEAGRNVLTMLQKASPTDYAILMTQLKTRAGMNGALGQWGTTYSGYAGDVTVNSTEESAPGFWERIFEVGTGALTTVVDYKMREETAKLQQDEYEAVAAAEMERQAMLAAKRQSQALEYQTQMEFLRQRQELDAAATRAKSKLNWALIAVGGLVGLFILGRVLA